jgi:hypothetical protein
MAMKKIMALALFVLLAGISAQAVDRVWTGGTDANWSTAANWGGTVPGVGDRAWFSSASPVTTNVTLGTETLSYNAAPATVLYFNSAYNYTLTGGSLTLATTNTAQNNMMDIAAGAAGTTQTINSDLIMDAAGNQRIAATGGGHYVFNGKVTGKKAFVVRLSNTNSTATFNGGITLTNNASFLIYNGAINLKSKVSAASGSVNSAAVMQPQGLNTFVTLNNAGGVVFDSSLSAVYFSVLNATTSTYTTIRMDADDQIATRVSFATALWDLNGHSNTNTGALIMANTNGLRSTIDFSDAAAESVWFAGSSNQTWTSAAILDLVGFDFDTDELRFGTNANGLTTNQLSKILIDGAVVDTLALDSDGFLVIPEPATIGMLGLGALVTLVLRKMRR